MKNERTAFTHLSDNQLIALLYCGDLTGTHAADCSSCKYRLEVLRTNRATLESDQLPTLDLAADRLAIQRRNIYAQIEKPVSVWSLLLKPRWISAGATALILGGGLFVFQHQQPAIHHEDTISDSDLAQEVSSLSRSAEPLPAEPLKGLFE